MPLNRHLDVPTQKREDSAQAARRPKSGQTDLGRLDGDPEASAAEREPVVELTTYRERSKKVVTMRVIR